MDLQQHYDTMRATAFRQLAQGQAELDLLIESEHDTRRGITLLARPPASIRNRLEELLAEFRSIEPDQYFYPPLDMHLTILSIISCYPGFTLDLIEPAAYQEAMRHILVQVRPFTITFAGLTASAGGIMVQGFLEGTGLEQLRNSVRSFFRSSGLQQSIDQRYSIQTAHSTIMRFKSPLHNPAALLATMQELQQEVIGSFAVDTVELVYNDWYQRAANTVLLETYPLRHE
ncbi:2'-5' RNA ligase family protein [Hymenobacter fodinae]|uniref:Mutarotase n=1 Tax=Hymenobacter fodinae TaxID=2510796 RepID=A0A4Z0PD63_9BACT|nr:mutarotase [Hymenobacter fodinae]TGE10432.1 mutarotase [Hymenobacter fodinae]